MKLIMTSLESGEILFEVCHPTKTECICAVISLHTELYGEDYLGEILNGLSEMLTQDEDTYERHEFSDPEANFRLEFKE